MPLLERKFCNPILTNGNQMMILSHKLNTTLACVPVALSLTVMLSACGDDNAISKPDGLIQPVALHGIWEREGYGDVFVVDENGAETFQYTRFGCLKAESLDNQELNEGLLSDPQFSNDQSMVTVSPIDSPAFSIQLVRRESLPTFCLPENLLTTATPTETFEYVWHIFNDYYAFFNERNVDWGSLYAELQPYVNDDLSNDELIEVLEALLEPLDDGHVQLNTGDDTYSFDEYRGANRVIVDSFEEQNEFDDIQEYANAVSSKYIEIRSSYLDTDTEKSAGGEDEDAVIWGTIGDKVGYLRVARMEELANNEDSVEANLAAINDIMENVLSDLQSTNALIIDVRTNGGGEDAISLAIASYFTDQQRLAVSKYARSYKGDTVPVVAYLESTSETTYTNPITVIFSPDTASAAEIFIMAMSAIPYVTLVGENSNGIHSDILSKSLPNGWEIGLSNEVYIDHLGVNHEVTGVPPEVQAPTFSLAGIADGIDPAINAALEALGYTELAHNPLQIN